MKKLRALRAYVFLAVLSGWPVASVLADRPRPATDEEIKGMIAEAGDAEDYDGADFVYVLDESDIYVQKSGLATTEACQVIKILTDGGIKAESVLRWEFDPDTNRVTVRGVKIHREDASIEEVDLGALVTPPSKQHMIYWGGQEHLLPIPRLEIGDTLEIRTSKIGFNIAYLSDSAGGGGGSGAGELIPPMPGHWYEVTLFQGHYPIIKKRYTVHMPKDMPVQYEVYNGELKSSLWFNDEYFMYTWEAEDVPAVKAEPRMVALDDCVPKLVMATLEDWHAKSRWFYEVNEPQFEADDAIRAKVAELTDHLNTEEEKIAAVVHWVADNIRYYGTKQSGAREGYTLHKGINIFRERGGVCKDKASMAITMLRVLGHEVYPALTMAGSRVERIPADQFNHTITVMRNKDGSFRVLDPTWVPLTRGLWSSFEDLQGLVYGTPEGQDQTVSPHYEPEYNMRFVRSDGEIRKDGTLSTHMVFDLHGAADNRLRRAVDGMPLPERRVQFEHALNIAPNARLEKFAVNDVYDYSRDGFVDMQVTAEDYAADGKGIHLFRLPLMSHPLNSFFRASFMDAGSAEERKYAARHWATRLLRYEETLKLPPGWKVVDVPKDKTLDSPSAAMKFEAEPGDGTLTYRFELTLKNGVVPAEDHPGFKEAVDAMNEISDAWIVCTEGA
ncbi:MAG: DUF3857 domain-containing transglutaminase family protein [Planctomycetes bacterium]|nr:DUF3857 domain-containing transglutaminase family protein [Planctomycetota bacterium]